MTLIQWNPSLSVGVAEIDRQHQKLVGMINELHHAMGQGRARNVLGKLIEGLVAYAATHFDTEEKYFEQFGYPYAQSHKNEHVAFTRQVTEFKGNFDSGRLGVSVEVMNFLSDWLRNHITGTDKKYGPFFNEKGLK